MDMFLTGAASAIALIGVLVMLVDTRKSDAREHELERLRRANARLLDSVLLSLAWARGDQATAGMSSAEFLYKLEAVVNLYGGGKRIFEVDEK